MVSLLVTAMVFLAACSKSEAPAGNVDTAPMQKSFASADPTVKGSADRAVALIKQGNYQGALQELQALAGNAKLTDDQKKAINDTMTNVKNAVIGTFQKGTNQAGKILGDVQKSMGK